MADFATGGALVPAPVWSTALPNWETKLLAGESLVPDLPLFEEEAARALRVFKRLRMHDVVGTPTMGEAAGPWLFPIVEAIFGSFDVETNRRLIQEFFWLIPKKNAKTSSAAAIMLTALILNVRPAAEFSLIAPTKDIADRSFKQAAGAIRLDPALSRKFHIQTHIRTITHRTSDAKLEVKAADTDTVTGLKSTGTLIDETHVFASKSRAADIFVEIRGALAARPDGFLIQITTQSKDPPSGVFKSELQNARDVRDGKLALPLLPILYELPRKIITSSRWKQRKYWPLVNPNMGRSVDEAFLERELMKAEREGPQALVLFGSQHFNIEIGLGLRSDRWAGAEYWERRADPLLTDMSFGESVDVILERCEVVVVGIDGGGLDDLFGLCVLGREREETEMMVRHPDGIVRPTKVKRWLAAHHAWCHEGVLKRRQTIAQNLQDFAKRFELTIVGDELGDLTEIVAIVEKIKDAGVLGGVAVDPAGLGEFVDAMNSIGINADNKLLIGVPQSFGLMNAIKTTERKLVNGTLLHGGGNLMAWCVGNVKIEPTATAIRATKQNAGDAKIDPWCALQDAAWLMVTNPKPQGRSMYDREAGDDTSSEDVENDANKDTRTDWSPQVLNDPRHPDFEEHKRRFERWQDERPDEEDF